MKPAFLLCSCLSFFSFLVFARSNDLFLATETGGGFPREVPDGSLAACRFPESMQGVYKRQDDANLPKFSVGGTRTPINYLDYFVGPTSIPHWGDCYENQADQFILGIKKVGGYICYRCFLLNQRTSNVLQVLTRNEDLCYRTVEAAEQSCPDSRAASPGAGIILWKAEDVQYQYCPLGGKAVLDYTSGPMQCPLDSRNPSEISNCQLGFQLHIRLRGCSFTNSLELRLRCLGIWDAGRGNGEKYFAVYNIDAEEYRCGMYSESADGVEASAALSNDSSCHHLLFNSTKGFENFKFFRQVQPSWPVLESTCSFPDWLVGDWETMTVQQDLMSYYHHHNPDTMSTQYAKCVSIDQDKIKIFARNHCGEPEGYSCLWVAQRSQSVMELKLGRWTGNELQCQDPAIYSNSTWLTRAVRKPEVPVPCPHLGHFSTPLLHQLTNGYCFNITVDCDRPDMMKTVGYLCGKESDSVFDIGHYQCIGTWKEDNTFYSYTRRLEDQNKGCFVSREGEDGGLEMVWTGEQCRRDLDFTKLRSEPTAQHNLFILQQNKACPRENRFSKPPDLTTNKSGKPRVPSRRNSNSSPSIYSQFNLLFPLFSFLLFVSKFQVC